LLFHAVQALERLVDAVLPADDVGFSLGSGRAQDQSAWKSCFLPFLHRPKTLLLIT
jgi:hypothetical protein